MCFAPMCFAFMRFAPICFVTIVLAAALTLAARPTAAAPLDPEILAAVSDLGRVNGMALHCHAPAQVKRIKDAMIETVPKLPEIADTFDTATNDTYVAAAGAAARCPTPPMLKATVDAAVIRLKVAAGRM